MSSPDARHRATRQSPERGGRRVAPRPRPRYGRIAALGTALLVTSVAVVAALLGLSDPTEPAAAADRDSPRDSAHSSVEPVQTPAPTAEAPAAQQVELQAAEVAPDALPADSGSGRRVVFDQSAQRVWLVEESGEVARTYLVSGSVLPNLQPGTYEVYSTSRWAVGIDDSGVMQYFVRFTRGDNAAIGFHSIPTKNGEPLQTRAQLGTPQSHGCIRQALPDAIALWDFAPEGTSVVVTA